MPFNRNWGNEISKNETVNCYMCKMTEVYSIQL